MIKTILPTVVFIICVVLTGYGEDPYFPQTDPENHGIPLEVLEELSVAINEYFESD